MRKEIRTGTTCFPAGGAHLLRKYYQFVHVGIKLREKEMKIYL